jgi:hypothetical protein
VSDKTRISRISVGRVYNLGNYEHIRYELTVDIPAGESATEAIKAVEALISGLQPIRGIATEEELSREAKRIAETKMMSLAEFERRHGQPVGGPEAYIKRCEESLEEKLRERKSAERKTTAVRKAFDDLGGAAKRHDAKLDWDDDDGGDL